MPHDHPQEEVAQMFNEIASGYDRLNHILSFGIDKSWRKELIKHLPEGNSLNLIDLATGTCDQLIELMKTRKFSYGLGIDFSEKMIEIGRKKIASYPFAKNIILNVADAHQIPSMEGTFDCATISFGIRNTGIECLKEMLRVLKPRGKALILEFSLPENRLLKRAHLLYLRHFLPHIGGLLSGRKEAYRYLNRTIESFPYGDAFLNQMKHAGFIKVEAIPLTFGIATLYIGEKK